MKKIIILCWLLLPFILKAQIQQFQTEYNRKGDEAMKLKDFEVAKYWYEEGVAHCDTFSIARLTEIWQQDTSVHASMRVVMVNCLNCLNRQAQVNDTLAIKKLIDYYTEGIGTAKNEGSANFWKEHLEQLRHPVTVYTPPAEPKERMKFFAGYHASPVAPFGIQVGGMGKTVGWYVRLRSNLIFQDTRYDCRVEKRKGENVIVIDELENEKAMYQETNTKESWLMGSAGIIYKVATGLYVSTGVGYVDRKYAREYIKVEDSGENMLLSSGWAKDINSSFSGFAIDLDGTYVFNGRFYVSLGASMMKFNYVYPNVGVGVYF
jgi:beta-lactamase class D